MKVLLTGGSGLLGFYLNKAISNSHNLLTLYHSKPGNCQNYNSLKIDITDYCKTNNLLNDFKPNVIIHCAAASSPDKTQGLTSKEVYELNVNATKNLAAASSAVEARLIYLSTDLVYAGYRGQMLIEESKLAPASLYAETKLMGEEKIKEYAGNYLILRTALLFGLGFEGTSNHFDMMYNSLKCNKTVNLFFDQYRTPLALKDAAGIISHLININTGNETVNFGGKERVSRLELGEMLCALGGYDRSLLNKISLKDIAGIPDVADVSLNTDKLQSFGFRQKTINESIYEILNADNK